MTSETLADLRPHDHDHRGDVLQWGVKTSFRRYVASLPDGVCEFTSEVSLPGAGIFGFPGTSVDRSAGAGAEARAVLRYCGTVVFRGHGGVLAVQIADPWLERTAGHWHLTCRDPLSSRERLTLAGTQADAVVVTAGPRLTATLSVALSAEGAAIFGGSYPPGEPLDDVVLRLSEASASCFNVQPIVTPASEESA